MPDPMKTSMLPPCEELHPVELRAALPDLDVEPVPGRKGRWRPPGRGRPGSARHRNWCERGSYRPPAPVVVAQGRQLVRLRPRQSAMRCGG